MINKRLVFIDFYLSADLSIAISRRENQLKEAASFDAASFFKSNSPAVLCK
jgi:hypothetical protein